MSRCATQSVEGLDALTVGQEKIDYDGRNCILLQTAQPAARSGASSDPLDFEGTVARLEESPSNRPGFRGVHEKKKYGPGHRAPTTHMTVHSTACAVCTADLCGGAHWDRRHNRISSCAISFGRNTASTHPVSIALMGMLGKRADPGYWANVVPPPFLIACTPRAPSEPPPESTTAIAASALSSASEMNRVSPGRWSPPVLGV